MEYRPIRVLIIEDNPEQVHLLETGLGAATKPPFQVECVGTLSEAIQRIAGGNLDVILLDLNLPDSRGLDTVVKIHAQNSSLPIVVLTGSYDEALATNTLLHGAQDYLLKGFVDHNILSRSMRYAIERKRAEEEIVRAHAKNEQLLSAITSILICVDSAGFITHWNKVAEQTFGISRRETVGKLFSECGIQWTAPDVLSLITSCLSKNTPGSLDDIGFKYPDGRDGLLGITVIPVREREKEGVGFVLFGADITEKKQAEEEKTKLEEHVRQVQKMESLGTLAGGIAHDFKNILGPIMGYTEMIMRTYPARNKDYDRLEKILKSAYRAKDLVDQILTFSRKNDESRVAINFSELADEALALLKEVLPSSIEIVLDLEKDVGTIVANPTQILQVIMNLCINAGYAMRENGGKLAISVKRIDANDDFIKLHTDLKPGSYVQLSVSDTGSGISSEVLPRIFDPFFTTKPIGDGSGMGLAVVHGIVNGHGGIIEASSKIGEGTVFNVYLPHTVRGPGEKKVEGTGVPHGTERIMVVDDDVNHADMLADMLESLGYQIEKKTSSVKALELFTADPNHFNLVMVDQIMPKITGTKLAVEMMKIRPDLPIILCTGSYLSTLKEAHSIGIRKCLEKPVSITELARAIREILDNR
jgi:PAS domain S-box-containing protein